MTLSRRNWLKIAAGGTAGLALADLGFGPGEARAATGALKLKGTKEFTTACNFCSCGCGMVAHVRDGQLVNLEGDPDHAINFGALCTKGAAMKATHDSPRRVKAPMYRAPGSDRWEEISWDQAYEKLARKLKEVRDASWTVTEKDGDAEYPVNRTDAIALMGGAQNTNEECYLFNKMGRLLGTSYVEHQARL
ncbi:molybdopterin oxidoreductase Fe4S4 region [Anaeromyxobacter dehalogenans 2CP-C]|nr:molybdopterin oxidoreductase Fe4S4 region [Anaeromyxobacter dehalogenans 2CP-C]